MRITIHTNSDEYEARIVARADELVRSIRQTSAAVGKIALERAQWWSSGPYSLAELERLGHPYARRNAIQTVRVNRRGRRVLGVRYRAPIGEGFPARINVQEGKFLKGWRWKMRSTADGVTGTLFNTSDRIPYLAGGGTRRMMGRPVMRAIMKDVRKGTRDLWRKVFHRALTRNLAGPVVARGGWGAPAAFRRGFEKGFLTEETEAFKRGYEAGNTVGGD